jgi:nucleoside-diphosphate-sugar epimerase
MDFLNPAVQGTTQLLTSIKEHGPAVKRVVITSSCAAVIDFDLPVGGGRVYTSEDWNPVSWDEALSTKNLSVAYRASKKYAELAGWFASPPSSNMKTLTHEPKPSSSSLELSQKGDSTI